MNWTVSIGSRAISPITDWDEARLWRTYTLLTDIEAVFRALKSESVYAPLSFRA